MSDLDTMRRALELSAAGKLKTISKRQQAAVKRIENKIQEIPSDVQRRTGIYVQLSPYLRALLRLTKEQER